LLGFGRTRKHRWPLMLVILCALTAAGNIGCGDATPRGSGTQPNSSTNASAGSYTLTVTGTDTTHNLSSNTTFVLTVQ
jgi:hypothetical protein